MSSWIHLILSWATFFFKGDKIHICNNFPILNNNKRGYIPGPEATCSSVSWLSVSDSRSFGYLGVNNTCPLIVQEYMDILFEQHCLQWKYLFLKNTHFQRFKMVYTCWCCSVLIGFLLYCIDSSFFAYLKLSLRKVSHPYKIHKLNS